MSQGGIANFNNSGLGFIQTINGDTGSITGHTVTIYANNAANGAGAYVKFTNSGTVSTLTFNDVFGNLYLGQGAGTASGADSGNVGIGINSLHAVNNSTGNTAIGSGAGLGITTGNTNILVGYAVAQNLTTGSGNIIIGGPSTGTVYTTESYNICIYSDGIIGESNVIRIGRHGVGVGAQSSCYIAGIRDVTVSNPKLVTINSSTSQLGVVSGNPIVSVWTDVTGATQTLAVGNGYITDRGGGVTYTLPSTASLGDVIEIVGKAGLATITPNANQQINIGSASGTVGVTGTAVATNAGDCIQLRCTTSGASTVWRAQNFVGNWTLT